MEGKMIDQELSLDFASQWKFYTFCFSQSNDYAYQIPKKLNDGGSVWMASITKTVTSTLIGIAVDKEFIASVETKLHELLPQFPDDFKDPEKRKISLKHIMTMTSGLDWNERVSYNNPRNSEWQMVESEDWMNYIVSHPVIAEPGKIFNYNTGGMHLLSAVIKSVSSMYAHQFAEKYLLHPMWYPCTGGTDGGLGLRTRDIAKFGWLFLKDGKWKGKQIVPEKWVKQAPKISLATQGRGRSYGFNWMTGIWKQVLPQWEKRPLIFWI
jgi:CubicO group peptidase (beta-lactamase class C family)